MYGDGIGLRLTAPHYGYWFDEYNSTPSPHETINKMRNDGRTWFLQNPAEEDRISDIFGGSILTELEEADQQIFNELGQHLLHNPDSAYDRSEAVRDLSTPPDNDQDLINKVALLSVIIDGFRIRLLAESKSIGTLDALNNWLTNKMGKSEANKLTEVFLHVRSLRNQYPLHNRYDKVRNGRAIERNRIKAATLYFKFQDHDDCTAKWKKICDTFKDSNQDLTKMILA